MRSFMKALSQKRCLVMTSFGALGVIQVPSHMHGVTLVQGEVVILFVTKSTEPPRDVCERRDFHQVTLLHKSSLVPRPPGCRHP